MPRSDHHMIEPIFITMMNTLSNLYKAEWLNLVFKNRNQAYGAYQLRSESGRTSMQALIFGSAIFILLFTAPKIYSLLSAEDQAVVNSQDDERIVEVVLPPRVELPKIKEELLLPKADPIAEKIKTVKPMSRPTPVADAPPFTPPTIEEMDHAAVGQLLQMEKKPIWRAFLLKVQGMELGLEMLVRKVLVVETRFIMQ